MTGIRALLLAIALLLSVSSGTARAQELDVYVVHSSSEVAERDEILEALGADVSVRTYNADLLVLADYSGRQKVLSKIDRAKVVIVIGDAPLQHLRGRLTGTALVMVNTVLRSLASDVATLHLLPSDADTGELDASLAVVRAASEADLRNAADARSADVVLVNEDTLRLPEAVALITDVLSTR